jgi:hypothetical protein
MCRLKGAKERGLQQAARWRLDLLLLFLADALVNVVVFQSVDVLAIIRCRRRGLQQLRWRRNAVVELGVPGG